MVLYIILIITGTTKNGTRAWLYIGPVSFQATEPIKFLSVITLAGFLSFESISERFRYLFSLGFLAFNAVGLILIKELGTLLLLCLVFITLCALFLKARYSVFNLGLAFITMGGGIVLVSYIISLFDEGKIPFSGIVALSQKISNRFSTAVNSNTDPLGGSFQLLQGQKAMILGGPFGNKSVDVTVPVGESDFIFSIIVLRLGCIFGAVILILFLLSWICLLYTSRCV